MSRILFFNLQASILVSSFENMETNLDFWLNSDLIIFDGIEEKNEDEKMLEKIKNIINYKKTETLLLISGRFYEENCLTSKVWDYLQEIDGLCLSFPVSYGENILAWPKKYPSEDVLLKELENICGKSAFYQYGAERCVPRYLLEILSQRTTELDLDSRKWTEEEKAKVKEIRVSFGYDAENQRILTAWGIKIENSFKVQEFMFYEKIDSEILMKLIEAFVRNMKKIFPDIPVKFYAESEIIRRKFSSLNFEPKQNLTCDDYEKFLPKGGYLNKIFFNEHARLSHKNAYIFWLFINSHKKATLEAMFCSCRIMTKEAKDLLDALKK